MVKIDLHRGQTRPTSTDKVKPWLFKSEPKTFPHRMQRGRRKTPPKAWNELNTISDRPAVSDVSIFVGFMRGCVQRPVAPSSN